MNLWRYFGLLFFSLALPTAAGGLTLHGTPTQGGLMHARVDPGARVWLDGEEIRVGPKGDLVFGFGRDAAPQAELRVVTRDGLEQRSSVAVAARDYKIQRVDGLPPRKVTPKAADLKRIRQDSAEVTEARRRDDSRTDYLSGWQWPVIGRISGVYGSQRVLNGKPKRPHFGVDIAAPAGTPVLAPADGVVSMLHPDMFYSGVTLLLDHGQGVSTAYLHLKKALVKPGQQVRRGQRIAEVGSSGRATGPHLHWGMNWFTTRLDPGLLVGPMPASGATAK